MNYRRIQKDALTHNEIESKHDRRTLYVSDGIFAYVHQSHHFLICRTNELTELAAIDSRVCFCEHVVAGIAVVV